ncbi:MAG: hypothetical protein MZV63_08640 [Marinilabiliales bacterium]|nr:hypothetical protein [Marinilabiliales bacterium]
MRSLGASAAALMGAFSSQLAALGLNVTPPEIIKINLKVGGTFTEPVITPLFAGSAGSRESQHCQCRNHRSD